MQVPKDKMELRSAIAGQASKDGWLVVTLKGLDLDGVTSLEINLDHLQALQAGKQQGADLFAQLVKKLG